MVTGGPYVPARGDLVWLSFNPQTGHEQAGRRPAFVVSPRQYNERAGLAIFCPVTSPVKGYPFEVALPDGLPVSGAVLADQARSLDWRSRRAEHICSMPEGFMAEVLGKLRTLI